MRLSFAWDDAGSVKLDFDFRGIPAVAYQGTIGVFDRGKFIPDCLLVLLTLWYAVLTWTDIVMQLRAAEKVKDELAHNEISRSRSKLDLKQKVSVGSGCSVVVGMT